VAVAPTFRTSFRGGAGQTLKDEFAAYGLPGFAFYAVGALKIGALAMHRKVGDLPMNSLPAALMLVMSAAIFPLR
jgi:hypothetical protein